MSQAPRKKRKQKLFTKNTSAEESPAVKHKNYSSFLLNPHWKAHDDPYNITWSHITALSLSIKIEKDIHKPVIENWI